jgi:hypothetical protein
MPERLLPAGDVGGANGWAQCLMGLSAAQGCPEDLVLSSVMIDTVGYVVQLVASFQLYYVRTTAVIRGSKESPAYSITILNIEV